MTPHQAEDALRNGFIVFAIILLVLAAASFLFF